MRGNQQRDARRDEHRADDGNDGEEIAAAVLLELEMPDDFLPLLIGDESSVMEFLNVGVFHFFSGLYGRFEPDGLSVQ